MRRLFPDNTFVAPAINEGTRLVIGEAPGSEEEILGEPLVGPTGRWLRGSQNEKGEWSGGLLGKAGIRDKEVSRANCIQCRPPDNVFPTDPAGRSYISADEAAMAVRHCYDSHVLPLLRSREWKRVDLLGSKACDIVAKVSGGVMRWRGSPLPIPDVDPDRLVAVPTIHPAALARDQSLLPVVVSDLKKGLTPPPENYTPFPSLDEVKAFTATRFSFDIETDIATGRVICVGLCAKASYAMVVPVHGAYIPELKRIFTNAEYLITQNGIAFDIPRLFPVLGIEWKPNEDL